MTCTDCPLGETQCYFVNGDGAAEYRRAGAFLVAGEIVWRDVVTGDVVPNEWMVNCDPCRENPVDAETAPWTFAAADLIAGTTDRYRAATKTLSNGVIIRAAVVGTATFNRSLTTAVPSGAVDPNALTMINPINGNTGGTTVRFTVNRPQRRTRMRVIDLDGNVERAYVFGVYATTVPVITPLTVPGGNPGGAIRVVDGTGTYFRAPGGGNERAALLAWDTVPWAVGTPIQVRYSGPDNVPTSARASQYDFGGPFTAQLCN